MGRAYKGYKGTNVSSKATQNGRTFNSSGTFKFNQDGQSDSRSNVGGGGRKDFTQDNKFNQYDNRPNVGRGGRKYFSRDGKFNQYDNRPNVGRGEGWKDFNQGSQFNHYGKRPQVDRGGRKDFNQDSKFSQYGNMSNAGRGRGGRDFYERSAEYVGKFAATAGMKWNLRPNQEDKCLGYKGKLQPLPVPKEKLIKHDRGEGLNASRIGGKNHRKKMEDAEEVIKFSIEHAARTEILLPEDAGFLEADEGEDTAHITQSQIVENTDITSATKHFELILTDFGPYRMNYSRNGRYLLLGGRKGHIAAFDWVTKKLYCEINVMEEMFDVQWLHNELMFAVAQKKWTFIYDNQGVELHCIKQLNRILRMEFLPYHFLLAAASDCSFVSWLDVSMGKLVAQMFTGRGRLNIMAQNPYNALVCLGHPRGTVTMWTPNSNKPAVDMFCHTRPLQAIAIDSTGKYMATSCISSNLRIWDIRNLKGPVQDYNLCGSATNLVFSQRSVLAASLTSIVETFRDCCTKTAEKAYMRHMCRKPVAQMQFCPYEDVLGVGTAEGFTSLIIPGSGEPNFDALELNPYETKKQRQETEVKALLEKIQPEFITLDPGAIAEVDVPTLQDKLDAKAKLMQMNVPKIDFTPRRNKRKGSVKVAQAKKIVREQGRREFVKNIKNVVQLQGSEDTPGSSSKNSVLDRFRPKKKI